MRRLLSHRHNDNRNEGALERRRPRRHANSYANPNYWNEVREDEDWAILAYARREGSLRDVRQYQDLLAEGAHMPPFDRRELHLNVRQDIAMFRELQRRGAFQVRGMRDSRVSRSMSDAQMYSQLRNHGYNWSVRARVWFETTPEGRFVMAFENGEPYDDGPL